MNLWNFANQIVRADEGVASPTQEIGSTVYCTECEGLIPHNGTTSSILNRKKCFSCEETFCLKCAPDIKESDMQFVCNACSHCHSCSSLESIYSKKNFSYSIELSLYCSDSDFEKLMQTSMTTVEIENTSQVNLMCSGQLVYSQQMPKIKHINCDHRMMLDIRNGLSNSLDIELVAVKNSGKRSEFVFAKSRINLLYCCLQRASSVEHVSVKQQAGWIVGSCPLLVKALKHSSAGFHPMLRWRSRLAISDDRETIEIGQRCTSYQPSLYDACPSQMLSSR